MFYFNIRKKFFIVLSAFFFFNSHSQTSITLHPCFDIDPGDTENIFDNTEKPETTFKVSVNGTGKAWFGFAIDPEIPVTLATGKEVSGDAEEVYFTAAELGFTSEKKNLNVTNPEAVTLSYSVEKV